MRESVTYVQDWEEYRKPIPETAIPSFFLIKVDRGQGGHNKHVYLSSMKETPQEEITLRRL